ncbi:MAG: GNAT family N-acetyltransferase [Clostridium sp.]|nr:GNAT family N-acetyltransferase [Clostridium sp.]
MYSCENLDDRNVKDFKILNSNRKYFNSLNKDFFNSYKSLNFIQKYFERKRVKLLNVGENYCGYLWVSNNSKKFYNIESMSISSIVNDKKFFRCLLNSITKKGSFLYKCERNAFNYQLLEHLGFYKTFGTLQMYKNLNEIFNITFKDGLSVDEFIENKDEKKRCKIQNDIFKKEDRIPLSVQDIYFDESQDYYLNKGCFFLNFYGITIGYGQIILNDNIPTIVNFGVISEYRGRGYGKIFILFLLNVAFKKGYEKILLKVDSNNVKALNLYSSVGFKVHKEVFTLQLNYNYMDY